MDAYGAPSRTSHGFARTHRSQLQPTEHPKSSPVDPISPLLLERLQRSRRVENDRVSSRSSTDMLSSSTGSRHVRSPSPTSSYRPGSSGGLDPAKAKKGLGVKEMEQTLSTLHKQNFDLKLELYHRRERQTALEERLDAVEREARERDDLNDSLVKELEKRDKAVEEAIGMILTLEKRVEQLLVERNMVRQVEAGEVTYSRIGSPLATPAPKSTQLESSPFGDTKTPIRMPSFVSERSENTENLRSVYLGTLAGESALTLPRFPEDTPDTARMDPRLASPALSELSESSFVSIYGRGRTVDLSSPPGNSPWPWDGSSRTPLSALESPTRVKSATPSRQHRPSSSRATSGQYHNIGDVLDARPSPLQRLEKLDATRAAMRDSPRPSTASKVKDQSPFARPPTSHTQPKTKKEKREALEKVLTQGHFNSPQTLPPTPDTLSTTTLQQNETPCRERGPEHEGSYITMNETTSRTSGHDEHKASPRAPQPVSTTAFDSRKHLHTTDGSSYTHSAGHDARQPRSAAETTNIRGRDGNNYETSRYRPTRRDSTTSSVDTWLRESLKPDSMDALGPMSSVSQAHGGVKNGRISPDLFSFPTSNAGWASHAMCGALGGSGYIGAGGKNVSTSPIADMLDAIGAAVPTPPIPSAGRMTPVPGAAAPPTPNRRSSLLARTGSIADATPGTESIPQSPPRPVPCTSTQMRSPGRGNRTRSNSTDVRHPTRHLTELGLKQDRAMTVPPKQVHLPPPTKQQDALTSQDTPPQPLSKQRHYPPTTSRPRSRGLNSFFRRSTGSADAPAPPASAPPTESPFKPPPPTGMGMGMPSWVRRGSLADDDRASATPPPILRNKAVPPSGGVRVVGDDEDGDGGVVLDSEASPAGGGVSLGAAPCSGRGNGSKSSASPRKSWGGQSGSVEGGGESGGVLLGGAGAGGGGKRKWLGLGRVSSLRNRGGA